MAALEAVELDRIGQAFGRRPGGGQVEAATHRRQHPAAVRPEEAVVIDGRA